MENNNTFIFPDGTYGRMAEEYFLRNEDPIVKEKFPRIWVRNLYDAFINLTKEFINSYNNENKNLPYDDIESLRLGSKTIYNLPQDFIVFMITLEEKVINSHISINTEPYDFEPINDANIEYYTEEYPFYKKMLYDFIQKLKEGGNIDE